MKLITNILYKLEDPTLSYMGPYIKFLNISGLFYPQGGIKRCMLIFITTVYLFFMAAEVIDLWYIRSNRMLLLNNLKLTVLTSTTIAKAFNIFLRQKQWREITNYIIKADIQQNKSDDPVNQKVIRETMKLSRKVTSLYCFSALASAGAMMLIPLLKYALSPMYRQNARSGEEKYLPVAGTWIPWDESTLPGYIAASIFHVFCIFGYSFWVTGFDLTALAIMTFLHRELKLLRRDSAKIFGSVESPVDDEEIGKRIMECHVRHTEMIKCAKVFNSCLRPVMSYYVINCSIVLCMMSYQMSIEKSPIQKMNILMYLAYGLMQLFLYCWHGNTVLYTSEELYLGPYESIWWNHKAHRKSILLLMIQFSRGIVFTAAPFGNLDLTSFINILKGAYSYYTVLSQTNSED